MFKILVFSLIGILTAIVTVLLFFQSPLAQTMTARMLTDYLAKELNTKVHIDKLHIHSFKSFTINNIILHDLHQDTLFRAQNFSLKINTLSIKKKILHLQEINLDEAIFRLKTYKNSDELNLDFIINQFNSEAENTAQPAIDSEKSEPSKPWSIKFKNLTLSHSEFTLQDQNWLEAKNQMDYADLKITGINLDLVNFSKKGDTLFAKINHLSANEKSGFVLDSLSGDFKLSSKVLQATNLKIKTPINDLNLDLKFSYEAFKAYNNFIEDIHIEAQIKPSTINLSDVGYFAEVMYPMDNRIKISGEIKGTVDNFKAKNFKFAFGNNTQFRGNINMRGLPQVKETYTHLSISDFETSAIDVTSFRLPTPEVFIPLPIVINNFGKLKIKGKFTGFYNDFVSYANFKTDIGNINTDLELKVNSADNIAYNGKIKTINLDAGKLVNLSDKIGLLTFSATVDGSGLSENNAKFKIHGLIDSVTIFNNSYRKISLAGNFDENMFTGDFQVDDKKAQIDFNGFLDFRSSIPVYNFTAKIENAYLQQLNLVQRTPSMCLSTNMNIDIRGDNIDNMQGFIKLNDTEYSEKGEAYFMKDFTLSITRDLTDYAFISLYSDIVDAMIEGKFKLGEVPARVENLFNSYLDTLFVETIPPDSIFSVQNFIFEINLKQTEAISKLFVPQLLVDPNTFFSGEFNSRINNMSVAGYSPNIEFMGSEIKDWNFDFYLAENEIILNTGCSKLNYSDEINIENFNVKGEARNDSLLYTLEWDNIDEIYRNNGDISGYVSFENDRKFMLKLDHADITIKDSLWRLSANNFLKADTGLLHFNDFTFQNQSQSIGLDGIVSHNPQDSIQASFNQFDLGNLKIVLERLGIDLKGIINGEIKLMNYYGLPNYISDIHISDLYFNNEELGEALLSSTWDSDSKALEILGQIIYTGNIGKRKTLDIAGTYFPKSEAGDIDIDISLENYKLLTLEPFMTNFASNIRGLASGKLKLFGTVKNPEITGNINLVHSSMKINYLNVSYYFAGQASLSKNLIAINDIVVYDSLNNKAICSGKFTHKNLRDFQMDLLVKTDNILGLNTTRTDNDIFYGRASVGGDVRIYGPLDMLAFDIVVKSKRGTYIKLPITTSTDIAENDFIIFKTPEIDSAFIEPGESEDASVGVALNLDLNLTNDADIQLFLPYNMGNIRGRGHGQIIMDVTPEGNFTMNGDYLLDRGSFFLTLQNIINRDFEIRRGSKISWSGDPYNAEISMKAVYKIKTSLGDFDPVGLNEQRVSVDCIIGLSNNLYNPEITFSIEFPDMRESDKQFVYSRLDTTDQALMSQQMLSLLILNSFSSNSESSGTVSFNTYSLLTNQLNNWLSSISNDFDVGINYQPGDEISRQEVEVALSTQLFDDRVIIDGNVGMINEDNTKNTNEIVGEVTVEVMLTPDGRWRGKAFNKSNHDYLYRNYSPYTQGVGVFYTKEFSNFKDMFKSKRKMNN